MIGPNDKRARVTRCEACSKRKIKCSGGFPCAYCTRVSKTCIAPKTQPHNQDLIFVNLDDPSQVCPSKGKPRTTVSVALAVPPVISLDPQTKLSKHFFSVFIETNDFTVDKSHLNLIEHLWQTNSGLREAIVAVAALDASRRPQTLSYRKKSVVATTALKAYQKALLWLQTDLDCQMILNSDACLWSTFFLGLFELMYDVTGEGWVKHILYGTSKIMQLRGPAAHATGSGRSFFLTFRVFEVCRALIYNDTTFLDQPNWKLLTKDIWSGQRAVEWHPKEALLDLMISCSTLSMRGHALDRASVPPELEVLSIAADGLIIQSLLVSWSKGSAIWSMSEPYENTYSSHNDIHDSSSLLASIYYQATCIFLSGIFDYCSHHWEGISTPRLPAIDIQNHVTAILNGSETALNKTNIAGILLFFPLRVAGARARTTVEQQSILNMLHQIELRNFIVAGAFVQDLKELWHRNRHGAGSVTS